MLKYRKEVGKTVATETKTKTDFIGFSSTIEKEGREGSIQVFTQVQGRPVTDKELAELQRLQEEAAVKVEEILNGQ